MVYTGGAMKKNWSNLIVSFIAIIKTSHQQRPKIILERVFIDPQYILGLEPLNEYTSLLVLTKGYYTIKGSFDCLKKTLKRYGVIVRPVQLKLKEEEY